MNTAPSTHLTGAPFCAETHAPQSASRQPIPADSLRDDTVLFNDRELSFLRFQERVFEEAQDETTPLLERVKFLAIVGTHLDDFVTVRASELARHTGRRLVVESLVKRLLVRVKTYWRRRLLPALRTAGVHVVGYRHLPADDRIEVDRHFHAYVRPLLDPLPCQAPYRIPHVSALGMNLMVSGLDRSGDERLFVVRIPDAVAPLVAVPASPSPAPVSDEDPQDTRRFVWLDQVVIAHLSTIFPELRALEAYRFRLLRDLDVPLQTVSAGDPVGRVLEVLRRRETNRVAALIVERRIPAHLLNYLASGLNAPDSVVHRAGMVPDLRRLWEVSRIARPDLRTPPLVPRTPRALDGHGSALAAARERDVLFHHPYESFGPVVEMIREAGEDPAVTGISMTLYRTDRESPVVQALVDAARRGKPVRVLIELGARLDEHRNAHWWRVFDRAGAAVFSSPPGLKVHAKMALILRNEGGRLRRYAHLSSGNYNAFTAKTYTDLGLLTCDEEIASDVAMLFDSLCGGGAASRCRALTVAPIAMRERLAALVEREIACHRRGERGHIILKMNGLVDREVIRLLYRASQSGVHIDLLVRGICCLRPGVPCVSERIRVRSIVGRFLEHSRAWYFRNGGREDVYIGSADLMPRNLDRRLEIMAPLKDAELRRRVFGVLQQYLADNVKARELCADGRYVRVGRRAGEPAVDAQLALLHDTSAAPRSLCLPDTATGEHLVAAAV